MKRLVITAYDQAPKLMAADIPQLAPNNYLVRMKYAPINPSDLHFSLGTYGIKKKLPTGFGFEGSGVIEDAEDKKMIGRYVSVFAPKNSDSGTYSTYLLSPIQTTFIWPHNVDLRQIACSIVNPLTVLGFKSLIQKQSYKDILLSAANSQLSRMAIRYLSKHDINVYGTVRSQTQAEELLKLGAQRIFIRQQELSELRSLKPLLFLDAVGGDFACKVFNNLPFRSKMIVYGRLSKQSYTDINPSQIYYNKKSIGGFWLTHFLNELNSEQFSAIKQEVVMNHSDFHVKIRKEFQLQQCQAAFEEAKKGGSDGKVLFKL